VGTTAEDLRNRLDQQRNELGYDLEAIGDRVSPGRVVERRKAAARDRVRSVRDRLMGTKDDAMSAITQAPSAVGDKVAGATSGVGQQLSHAPDAAKHAAEGNPLAVGLIAFGAGLVVSSLLPTSEVERKAGEKMQPALEQAASGAADAAREVAEDVRPAIQEAASELKERATEATQSIQAEVKDAAGDTADAAKQAAGDMGNGDSGSSPAIG